MKLQNLPEFDLHNIVAILKSNSMNAVAPPYDGDNYNCWGLVAYYMGWVNHPYWLDRYDMEDLLKLNTVGIDAVGVRAGDIVVFRRGEFLTHTAIMMPDPSIIYHKPGGLELCITSIEMARNYGPYTFVRDIKNLSKNEETVLTIFQEASKVLA